MADAEGEISKSQALAVPNEPEDHSELAVRRRQVDLDAGRKPRAVAVFGIAAAQGPDLNAFPLKRTARLTQSLRPSATASHRVLGECALIEENAGIPPPDWQELPLAVCGQERPVLGL